MAETQTEVATKEEIIEHLSERLRNSESLSDEAFLKLATSYGKLMGWFK
jgi:hypothetical protein